MAFHTHSKKITLQYGTEIKEGDLAKAKSSIGILLIDNKGNAQCTKSPNYLHK